MVRIIGWVHVADYLICTAHKRGHGREHPSLGVLGFRRCEASGDSTSKDLSVRDRALAPREIDFQEISLLREAPVVEKESSTFYCHAYPSFYLLNVCSLTQTSSRCQRSQAQILFFHEGCFMTSDMVALSCGLISSIIDSFSCRPGVRSG